MKKLKSLASLLMAVALILSLGVAALAASSNTGTITINMPEAAGTTGNAYKVIGFDADSGAWEVESWAASSYTLPDSGEITITAAQLDALHAAASGGITADGAGTAALKFSDLEVGGYLVIVQSTNYTYTEMFVSNYSGTNGATNVARTAKGVKNDIIESKTVSANDTYVKVGDTVTYTVSAEMPAFVDNISTASLVFTDALSANTAYVDGTLEVKVNGAAVASGTAYTAAYSENVLTITFEESWLKDNAAANANKAITLTYNVTITGYRADGYTNSISATANINGESTSNTKTSTSYTAALTITKQNSSGDKLDGAEFVLKQNGKFVKVGDDGTVTYVDTQAEATKLTTGTDGTAPIQGIDPDLTYTLVEVKAPAGYAKNAEAEITFTKATGEGNEGKYTVNVTASGYTASATAAASAGLTVTDTALAALPSTGGVGIVIVSAVGVVMMLAFGTLFLVLKKKNRSTEA